MFWKLGEMCLITINVVTILIFYLIDIYKTNNPDMFLAAFYYNLYIFCLLFLLLKIPIKSKASQIGKSDIIMNY